MGVRDLLGVSLPSLLTDVFATVMADMWCRYDVLGSGSVGDEL